MLWHVRDAAVLGVHVPLFAAPWPREAGLTPPDTSVGPAITVKQSVHVTAPVSELVTVYDRRPGVAPLAIEILALRCVASVFVTVLTVIPVPLKVTVPGVNGLPFVPR